MVISGLNSASILAQVNFGTNSASILGIFLAVAGAALYFLRTVRPELSRDQDIFFAAVGLLCGFILIFQGWRLDPILQFGQLLLVGSTVFFAFESIRLRGIATEQAKRNTPIVDRDRPVSDDYEYGGRRPNYREERKVVGVEPLPYYEDEYDEPPRRIRGSRDTNRDTGRDSSRDNFYDDESGTRSRRPSSRRSDRPERSERDSSSSTAERPRRRDGGNARGSGRSYDRYDEEDWSSSNRSKNENDSDWDNSDREERRPSRRRPSDTPRANDGMDNDSPSPKPRRRRPVSDSSSVSKADDDAIPTDYVDFKPIESPDDDLDNPKKYDENSPLG